MTTFIHPVICIIIGMVHVLAAIYIVWRSAVAGRTKIYYGKPLPAPSEKILKTDNQAQIKEKLKKNRRIKVLMNYVIFCTMVATFFLVNGALFFFIPHPYKYTDLFLRMGLFYCVFYYFWISDRGNIQQQHLDNYFVGTIFISVGIGVYLGLGEYFKSLIALGWYLMCLMGYISKDEQNEQERLKKIAEYIDHQKRIMVNEKGDLEIEL